MLSTQSKYLGASSGGWMTVRPSRTASPAALASGPTLTNHWVDSLRLDDVIGPGAVPDRVDVRDLLGDDPALRAQFLLDLGPRLEPVHPVETRSGVDDPGALVENGRRRQVVPLADLEVVGVVRRGHLDRAGAEFRVDVLVGDHRDLPVHDRQQHGLADQVPVALVIGMHRDGRVAQHRLDPGGRDHHRVGRVAIAAA